MWLAVLVGNYHMSQSNVMDTHMPRLSAVPAHTGAFGTQSVGVLEPRMNVSQGSSVPVFAELLLGGQMGMEATTQFLVLATIVSRAHAVNKS